LNFVDRTGQVNVNGIKAIRLAALRPVPYYEVKCVKCGAESTEPHRRMEFATCRNSACGQPVRKPSKLEAERAAARDRDRLAEEAAKRHAEIRMAEDLGSYERPERYTPKPSTHQVMSQRERLEMRQRREEAAQIEREEREAREKPVRELTEKLNQMHRKIAELERRRLTDPSIRDVDFWVDPQVEGLDFLTGEGICEWNVAAFTNFAHNHPEFAITDHNLQILNTYFAKHETLLFSTQMLEKTYQRMLACGIQFDKPEADPAEQPANGALDYAKRPQANLTITPAHEMSTQQTFPGIDLNSGEPREYSAWEVEKMSGDEMKRKLQLTVEKRQLPSGLRW